MAAPATVPNSDHYREALRVAFSAARSAAERNRIALLKYPNVIDVSAGYKFEGGWITPTPAVVVTVLRKESPGSLAGQALPEEIDGIPVDVAPASPIQQLQHLASKKKAGTRGPMKVAPPGVPDLEPYLEPGDPMPVVADSAATRGADGGRGYKEPADLKLQSVTGAMTLLCHCSPDAGWATLKPFLQGIKKTFTLAMYDFSATYIVEAVRDAMAKADGPFTMNLDRRSNPKRDGEMTEEQIVDAFRKKLGSKFVYSTAAVGTLFPNAYHIKVGVRDGKTFWQSSGNWQQSNQPEDDASKLDERAQRRLLSGRNREWHVVCENAKLAKTFESYIQYDVKEAGRVARTRGPATEMEMPDLVLPLEEDTRALTKVKIFAPKKFTFTANDPVKLQPVLTPDNYGEHVLKLIRSAKESLCFQNQYIKISKTFPDARGKPGLKDLVDALLDRMNSGVDVRIILRNEGDTRSMLQAMKTYGFDMKQVKLLGGCHNKGIVVDEKTVLVSSQNYSADGVRFNRDAGVIVFHAAVAKYYKAIFDYDWEFRARQQVSGERGAMPLVEEAAAPSAGRTRGARALSRNARTISWDEYFED